jgi:malate dehydrogenase (oxaloacetate-decarboxylating)
VHKALKGKIETLVKAELETKDDLSIAYSPWVAEPCRRIAKEPEKVYDYTIKSNTVAVISDGSAVLWLGNIWAEASLPVMEWKCALFKHFAWVNAFPIVLDTQDTEEIIKTVKHIAPVFWWINLEDISAPRCFEIEERLKAELPIPVFHDDQHGTAIVTLAWLINSLKIIWKSKSEIKVVISGVWAAWVAITKLFHLFWVSNIKIVDSKGIIHSWRVDLNSTKKELVSLLKLDSSEGTLADAMQNADVFVWVSIAGLVTKEMVWTMAKDPIIFAMANPDPEIMPEDAYEAWAKIVATWRSDYPNQINNVSVFPWIMKWALKYRIENITDEMKLKAAYDLAGCVASPNVKEIIPSPLDPSIVDVITESVRV